MEMRSTSSRRMWMGSGSTRPKPQRLVFLLLAGGLALAAATSTPLWEMGYAVVPTPQKVRVEGGAVAIDSSWHIDAGEFRDGIAERTIIADLQSFHGLHLAGAAGGAAIRLRVAKGTVSSGRDAE